METFKNVFEHPNEAAIGDGPPNDRRLWWDVYTETEKAWACYYSTGDELADALKALGYTDDQIANEPLTGKYAGTFGKFLLTDFTPYCNKLK